MEINRQFNRKFLNQIKYLTQNQINTSNTPVQAYTDMSLTEIKNTILDNHNQQFNVKLGQRDNLSSLKVEKDIDMNQNINWKKQFYKQMNFQYFFATLKSNPIDRNNSFTPDNDNFDNDMSEESTFTSNKSNNDNQWKSLTKVSVSQELNNRRKSERIQYKLERERLENQMKEMRFFYNNGRYRYQNLEVRLRLPYLDANLQNLAQFQNNYINIPDDPEFRDQTSKRQFIEEKKRSLQERSYYQY